MYTKKPIHLKANNKWEKTHNFTIQATGKCVTTGELRGHVTKQKSIYDVVCKRH